MIDPKSYDDIVRHLGGLIPCYELGQPGCILEDAANEHCDDNGCLILSVYREGLRRGAEVGRAIVAAHTQTKEGK